MEKVEVDVFLWSYPAIVVQKVLCRQLCNHIHTNTHSDALQVTMLRVNDLNLTHLWIMNMDPIVDHGLCMILHFQ